MSAPPAAHARHSLDDPEPDSEPELEDGFDPISNQAPAEQNPTELGTFLQAQSRKRKVRAVADEHKRAVKRIRSTALQALPARTQHAMSLTSQFGYAQEEDTAFERGIHSSHVLQQVHAQADAFYCTACGAYYAGGPLRLLRKECSGTVARNRVSDLQLLSLGVLPRPGATIPSHARR